MGIYNSPPSYQDLLDEFNDALDCVVSGRVLSPEGMTFNIRVTLALLDVAHAARQGRPTHEPVARAHSQFCSYATDMGASGVPRASCTSLSDKAVTKHVDVPNTAVR